jgi:hypothetical protein
MTKRRRSVRSTLAAVILVVAALLAGCDTSNVPRGGPQLPSNPAFLGGSGDNTPTPSSVRQSPFAAWPQLPAFTPRVGLGLATLDAVVPRAL